jgi:segregation and condensation protein A
MEKLFYNTSGKNIRYNVRLDTFEGPLDLLLHLIKKNRVDIYDIPISVITAQYLEYIRLMKELNLDLAGEYLLMAATLTYIKSRMLVPDEKEEDETGEEPEDPRSELIRKLLDYQRYKEASSYFVECDMLQRDVFLRGYTETDELKKELEDDNVIEVSLFQLIEALKPIIKGAKEKIIHEITAEKLTIKDKINELTLKLESEDMFLFTSLFKSAATKHEIIVTFLALLEMIRLNMAKVVQVDMLGPIRVLSLMHKSVFKEVTKDEQRAE